MPVARHPPHKTVRALLTHTASTTDEWRQSVLSDEDALHGEREPIGQGAGACAPRSVACADCGAPVRAATTAQACVERRSADVSFRAPHDRGSSQIIVSRSLAG